MTALPREVEASRRLILPTPHPPPVSPKPTHRCLQSWAASSPPSDVRTRRTSSTSGPRSIRRSASGRSCAWTDATRSTASCRTSTASSPKGSAGPTSHRRCTTSWASTVSPHAASRCTRPTRAEIRLYTAAVLRHIPEEPLQPVPMGTVFLADEADVAIALRMDGYLKPGAHTGIPIGVYRAGGTDAADLSRRGLPHRARGGAPQHHRRVRAGDEDERGRVAARSRSSRTSRRRRGASPRCAST